MTDDQFKAAFAGINARFDRIDYRLDEQTAEISLMRAALERFGFMGKVPSAPAGSGSGAGLPMAAKGHDNP